MVVPGQSHSAKVEPMESVGSPVNSPVVWQTERHLRVADTLNTDRNDGERGRYLVGAALDLLVRPVGTALPAVAEVSTLDTLAVIAEEARSAGAVEALATGSTSWDVLLLQWSSNSRGLLFKIISSS